MGKQTEKNERRGVSLIEIMVVLTIFAILMVTLVLGLRNPQGSSSSSSMAQIVVQELQSARFRALSNQHPVAVVFPSAGGTRPHSQSLYIMEGWPTAHTAQVRNYKGEIPSGYIFVGAWSSADPITLAPAHTPALNISSWLSPGNKDFVVAFAPDGSVVTNDLPWFNGELRIAVCSGLGNPTAASSPSGTPVAGASTVNYYGVSQIFQPQTVCVSPQGSVSICPGLKGADSSVAVATGTAQPLTPPAAPPLLAGQTNQAPIIWNITVQPECTNATPTGCDTSIKGNGFLTLVVRANDPNAGDQLSCALNCSQISGQPAGQFSELPGGSRMRFDPNDTDATNYPNGCWKAVWIWAPSPAFTTNYEPPGTNVTINCEVSDDQGLTTTNLSDSTVARVVFLVINQGHIYFAAQYQGQKRLFSMAPDGTAPVLVSDPGWTYDISQPMVSPDGTKIAFCVNSSIYTMNTDGTGVTPVRIDPSATLSSPTWSPDGTQIIYSKSPGPKIEVIASNGVGAPTYILDGSQPRWSLALPGNAAGQLTYLDASGDVWATNLTLTGSLAGAPKQLTSTSGMLYPSWSPWGNVVYIEPVSGFLYEHNASSGVITTMNTVPITGIVGPASFSPDNAKVVLAQGNGYGTFAAYSMGYVSNLVPFNLNGGMIQVDYPSWSTK